MPTEFKISMQLGSNPPVAAVRTPNAARMLEMVDDLISTYHNMDDGSGGERPMTRKEAAQQFVDDMMGYVVSRSKSLKRDRLALAADEI